LIFFLLSWPVMMSPWVATLIFCLKVFGTMITVLCLPCRNILLRRIPESVKHESTIYRCLQEQLFVCVFFYGTAKFILFLC
jgi:hypothetical protein